MRTRIAFWSLVVVLVLSSGSSVALATDYNLIVAPARYSVIQVLFDVIEQRPSVLVSYQGEATTENPSLHVWNGSVWTPVGVHELQELGFLQRTPSRAVLIGDESLLPRVLSDGLSWLPEVVYIRDLGTASMLNELGQVFKWSDREYRWFAKRYNLDVEDQNAARRSRSWYEQPGPLKKEGPLPSGVYAPETSGSAREEEYIAPPALEPPAPVESAPVMEPAPPAPAPADEVGEIIDTLETSRTVTAPAIPSEAPAAEPFPIK